jgi:hypothetical protein
VPVTAPGQAEAVDVVDEPGQARYGAYVDGALAGFAQYVLRDGRIVFTHTIVEDRFEGRGVGSRLAAGALDDVRARDLQVEARCPFIAAYIERHPEHRDLLGPP